MLSEVHWKKGLVLLGGVALFAILATVKAQPPAPQPQAIQLPAGRGGGGGRGGGSRGSRFKIYPRDAVDRGLPAYNTTCGYCHGDRGKGGKAGPDLIASVVTLHDEDGVQLAAFVKAAEHSKVVKIDAPDTQMYDIAAYLHSRVVYSSGRGDVHLAEVLVGDPKAGELYFNGAGGCKSCHSPTGDLKGIGGKYDPAVLQETMVMPRRGRGGFGRGGGDLSPTARYAVVTLPSGESVKGSPLRVTDFDVTLRLADGSTRTWAREHGMPKVEITDPLQPHIDLMMKLSDTDMHNLTAYLATLK
ncbi:MAG TPA: cytochrome c [Verrucomicrobiae bacterium]|nr:cytochrome c [Verrucomicrobiae bacterium]